MKKRRRHEKSCRANKRRSRKRKSEGNLYDKAIKENADIALFPLVTKSLGIKVRKKKYKKPVFHKLTIFLLLLLKNNPTNNTPKPINHGVANSIKCTLNFR